MESVQPHHNPAVTWNLYTRVTDTTWPHIQPRSKPKDLFWGHVTGRPVSQSAFTFSAYSDLLSKTDAFFKDYAALNLDSESSDYAAALADVISIRTWVNNYNTNYPATPLQFVAFFHLNIINAQPSIVNYPDTILIGKSDWSGPEIVTKAKPYIAKIVAAHKVPGVLLGATSHGVTPYSNAEVLANFHAVIDPAPNGLGLSLVGYYYDLDDDVALLATLQALR